MRRANTSEIWVVEFGASSKWIPIGEPWATLADALEYLSERRDTAEKDQTSEEFRVVRYIKPKESRRRHKLFRGSK
jgi:hypothetical protein